MPTLLRWVNPDGSNGQCDLRCQNAKHPECDCRCNGLFHGKAREGTLKEIIARTDTKTLTQMAQTPPLNPAKARRKLKHFPAPNGRRTTHHLPTWRQVSPTHWTTSKLFDNPGDTTGEISLLPDGTTTLTLTLDGAAPHASQHPNLEAAKRAFHLLAK